mgnify:CR=1 FL=1
MSDIIGMYGAITGGVQDAVAMIDIPQDGFIVGIDWDLAVDLDADGEVANVELSFIATNQLSTNDVRGRLSSVGVQTAVLTAVGSTTVSTQKWLGSFDIAVAAGERIFLHANSTAGVTGVVRCNLFVDFTGGTTRRSARRR